MRNRLKCGKRPKPNFVGNKRKIVDPYFTFTPFASAAFVTYTITSQKSLLIHNLHNVILTIISPFTGSADYKEKKVKPKIKFRR